MKPVLVSLALILGSLSAVAQIQLPGSYSKIPFILHTPPNAPKNAPLMVMIHGCKEDAPTFEELTQMNAIADREGFYVLYPGQAPGANAMNCWNWFEPKHQSRGQGEPARIMGMIDDAISKYEIDSSRVYVAGLSSGAGMTAILISCYPDRFAGGAIHAGIAYGYAKDAGTAFQQMSGGPSQTMKRNTSCDPAQFKGRVLVVHGSVDQTVNYENTESILADYTGKLDPKLTVVEAKNRENAKLGFTLSEAETESASRVQILTVIEMKHAWSGAKPGVPYGEPNGPDASLMTWKFLSGK